MCASPHISIFYSSQLVYTVYVNYRYSTYEKPLAMASTPPARQTHDTPSVASKTKKPASARLQPYSTMATMSTCDNGVYNHFVDATLIEYTLD